MNSVDASSARPDIMSIFEGGLCPAENVFATLGDHDESDDVGGPTVCNVALDEKVPYSNTVMTNLRNDLF